MTPVHFRYRDQCLYCFQYYSLWEHKLLYYNCCWGPFYYNKRNLSYTFHCNNPGCSRCNKHGLTSSYCNPRNCNRFPNRCINCRTDLNNYMSSFSTCYCSPTTTHTHTIVVKLTGWHTPAIRTVNTG